MAAGAAMVPFATGAGAASPSNTMQSSGQTRTYLLYRPPSVAAGSIAPLVVLLHGSGGTSSPAQIEQETGFDATAAAHGWLVAYPQGSTTDAGAEGWHYGCCTTTNDDPSDRQFISDLIGHLVATQGADPRRVMVVGFSGGALMTYDIACSLAGQIAAIGSVSGDMVETPSSVAIPSTGRACTPSRPVPVLEIHGTADPNLPMAGHAGCGSGPCGPGYSGYFPPIPTVHGWWEGLDHCTGSDQVAKTSVETDDVETGCPAGVAVDLDVVTGGGHDWAALASKKDVNGALAAFFTAAMASPGAPATPPVTGAPGTSPAGSPAVTAAPSGAPKASTTTVPKARTATTVGPTTGPAATAAPPAGLANGAPASSKKKGGVVAAGYVIGAVVALLVVAGATALTVSRRSGR